MDPIYSLVWLLLSWVMKVSSTPAAPVGRHGRVFCSDGSEYCLLDHRPAPETPGPGAVTRAGPAPWAGSILWGAASLMTPEPVLSRRVFDQISNTKYICFWLRQELKDSQCPSVCPSGTSLSKAVYLHLSFRSLSCLFKLSFSSLGLLCMTDIA